MNRSISVLVPVLNEEKNLAPTIERLIDALTITIDDFEIIIVDDGSTDATRAEADRMVATHPFVRVISNPQNMGLGYCYKRGYQEATKDFFVYIPGDNTWPYRSFVELFGNLGRADIVTSYALNPEVRPLSRRVLSRLYTAVMNRLFGRQVNYFNGLTIYPVSFLRLDPVTTFGFGFQAEVLLKGLGAGLSYVEVGLPIDERSAGASKALTLRNIFSVGMTALRLFHELRIQRRWRPRDKPRHVQVLSRGPFVSLDELGLDPDTATASPMKGDAPSTGRVIVIAGASSGIGAALAKDLCEAEQRVFACSRSLDRLRAAFTAHPAVKFCACDVSKEEDVLRYVEFVGAATDHVDALINCAGGFGAIGPIEGVDSGEWIRTVTENLMATFLPSKHFLALLKQSSVPQIINVAGGGAFSPFPNFTAYACAKAAIVRLTETLAVELAAYGISVNAIAPGLLRTEVHNATLVAGPARAGTVQFRRTERLMRTDSSSTAESGRMETVQQCVRALLSADYRGLTGKTISANFDPWSTEAFRNHVVDISQSELYTMRRMNLFSLPDGILKTRLMQTWAKHRVQR